MPVHPTAPATFLHLKRIYFGHQSVGANILAGIAELPASGPTLLLKVVEHSGPASFAEPALVHARIGQNYDPYSKIHAFSQALRGGVGDWADIALFKFCYVDITAVTDIDALFVAYRNAVAELSAAHPHTLIAHVTVPVTTMPRLWRRIVGTLLRRHNRTARDNLARADFNRQLRSHFSGKAPLFDLAAVESQYPSGRTSRFTLDGREYEALVPSYSNDGRHLSERGRRVIAAAFLDFLAKCTTVASSCPPRTAGS